MKNPEVFVVDETNSETRLDKLLKKLNPDMPITLIQKLIRKKVVRLNGYKTDGAYRVCVGDVITFMKEVFDGERKKETKPEVKKLSDEDEKFIRGLVLYRDNEIIVINKPYGLPVQGGSSVVRHLDGLLDGLCFDYDERPKLVHRLDRDTSGVLVLARTSKVAKRLSDTFKSRDMAKIYWAINKGIPKPLAGRIDIALDVSEGRLGEMMVADKNGKKAATLYYTIAKAGNLASWVELMPLSGRKHQLRVHCAEIGIPILGDGKYGVGDDFSELEGKLLLHARAIRVPSQSGKEIEITAPIPDHMKKAFAIFGFDEKDAGKNPFERYDSK